MGSSRTPGRDGKAHALGGLGRVSAGERAPGAGEGGFQARNLSSPDRYRAASNCRSMQAGALGGRFHSRAAGGTSGGGVSFRISTVPAPTQTQAKRHRLRAGGTPTWCTSAPPPLSKGYALLLARIASALPVRFPSALPAAGFRIFFFVFSRGKKKKSSRTESSPLCSREICEWPSCSCP